MSKRSVDLHKVGENAWNKVEKINSELFTLTYGSIVNKLIQELENISDVNAQLEKMGYNIGLRLVDDFLAKSGIGKCEDFRDVAETIAKAAFKMFLGVHATVANFDASNQEFTLVIDDNPLNDFVELPEEYQNQLYYSNILCGVIRGSLEMVQMKVECNFTKDVLRGDDTSEIRVKLIEIMKDNQ